MTNLSTTRLNTDDREAIFDAIQAGFTKTQVAKLYERYNITRSDIVGVITMYKKYNRFYGNKRKNVIK